VQKRGVRAADPTLTALVITDKERILKDLFKNCHRDGMLSDEDVSGMMCAIRHNRRQ
jgi:hypothetical protein